MIKITSTTIYDVEEICRNLKSGTYSAECIIGKNAINSEYKVTISDRFFNLGLIVGMDIIHPGVAEAWALVTNKIYEKPIGYTKAVKGMIELFAKDFNLHRMQIRVKIDPGLLKWADTLGFYIEGIMIGYGINKEDYYLMARYF
jgi:hypothetical protein